MVKDCRYIRTSIDINGPAAFNDIPQPIGESKVPGSIRLLRPHTPDDCIHNNALLLNFPVGQFSEEDLITGPVTRELRRQKRNQISPTS